MQLRGFSQRPGNHTSETKLRSTLKANIPRITHDMHGKYCSPETFRIQESLHSFIEGIDLLLGQDLQHVPQVVTAEGIE